MAEEDLGIRQDSIWQSKVKVMSGVELPKLFLDVFT